MFFAVLDWHTLDASPCEDLLAHRLRLGELFTSCSWVARFSGPLCEIAASDPSVAAFAIENLFADW